MKRLSSVLSFLLFASLPLAAAPDAAALKPAADKVLAAYTDVTGGPGLTRETAWVLHREDPSAVRQEYEILRLMGLGRPTSQGCCEDNGRWFDTLTVPTDDGELTIWFDITAYFNAMGSELEDVEA